MAETQEDLKQAREEMANHRKTIQEIERRYAFVYPKIEAILKESVPMGSDFGNSTVAALAKEVLAVLDPERASGALDGFRSPVEELQQARGEIAALKAKLKELGEQMEFDRTKVAESMTMANKAIDSRHWLTEGRGSYEWDDDRWHDEFKAAAMELKWALEPLTKIAANWAGCPMKTEEVIAARVDLKAKLSEAEHLNKQSICVYCGARETAESREQLLEVMARHIAGCEKHPLKRIQEVVDEETKELRAKLAEAEKNLRVLTVPTRRRSDLAWERRCTEAEQRAKGAEGELELLRLARLHEVADLKAESEHLQAELAGARKVLKQIAVCPNMQPPESEYHYRQMWMRIEQARKWVQDHPEPSKEK